MAAPDTTVFAFELDRLAKRVDRLENFLMSSATLLRQVEELAAPENVASDDEVKAVSQLIGTKLLNVGDTISHRDLARSFQHKMTSGQISRVMVVLATSGFIEIEKVIFPQGGRPTVKYTRKA